MTALSQTALHEEWADWSTAPNPWDIVAQILINEPNDLCLATWKNGNKGGQLDQQYIEFGPAYWLSRVHAHGYLPHLETLIARRMPHAHLLHLLITRPGEDNPSAGAAGITRSVATSLADDKGRPAGRTTAIDVQISARLALSRALADDAPDAIDTELGARD